jgi:hypothetical protein
VAQNTDQGCDQEDVGHAHEDELVKLADVESKK